MSKYGFFKRRLKEIDRTQASLARYLSLKPQPVNLIISGVREVQQNEIKPIAEFLQIDHESFQEYVAGRTKELIFLTPTNVAPPQSKEDEVGNTDTVPIRVYDAAVCAGNGLTNYDPGALLGIYNVSIADLRRYTNAPPNKITILRVRGDSMEPTIKNGAWIWVDSSQTTPSGDGIYVLRIISELMVKRIRVDPVTGAARITSDNPLYSPVDVTKHEEIEVMGRVLSIMNVLHV